jgi:hypothetical protein
MLGIRSRITAGRIVLATTVAVLAALVAAVRAEASEPVVVRGETARLLRQAYDYQYRNSNRNVFRSSNHYHPTKNIFRSSNYYKRRLATSFDGYPLRTIVRYASHHGGRAHEHVYSFAHPRRQPYGPGWNECGWWDPAISAGDLTRILIEGEETEGDRFDAERITSPRAPTKTPRSRWEIETVPVHLVEREPTQRAVMKTIDLPDGRTKTIITSEPIEPALDEAWARLTSGEHEEAAERFAARSLDLADGTKATVGYGLARALAGDDAASARAIQRALEDDPDILAKIDVDGALRAVIERIAARLETDRSSAVHREADAVEAASLIGETCRVLLEREAPVPDAAD